MKSFFRFGRFNNDILITNDLGKYYVLTEEDFYRFTSDTIPVDSDLSENFTISYCKSNSSDSPIEFQEYHSEWVRSLDNYIISIAVPIEDDGKYTFVKIEDKTNKINNKLIIVELNGSYTWKIVLVFLSTYFIVIALILLTCIFGKNFLAQCCNFKRKKD